MKINLLKCGKSILTIILAFSVLAVSLFTGAFAVAADTVTFVSDSDLADNGAEDVDAFGAVPSLYQYEYYKQEMAAFLHFGLYSFYRSDQSVDERTLEGFTLTEKIDADSYVKFLKDNGFSRVIVTAKHHDGFCIFESDWTEYDITNTNYPGDVLEDLSAACTKYDMDMGLYMSPWDYHSEYYGYYDAEGNPCTSTSDDVLKYNDYFVGQLTEILGNDKYGNDGRFVEIWLDPAKNSSVQQWYDYTRWKETILNLEGEAAGAEDDPLIFGIGSYDNRIHWIGNERGIANEETWSKIKHDATGYSDGGTTKYKGTEAFVGAKDGNIWTVMEADTALDRWGWRTDYTENPKSLDKLKATYLDSVGHNATLLLDIPLNHEGELPEGYRTRTEELVENIQQSFFENNLAAAKGATIYASDVQSNDICFKPSNVVDENDSTYWTATQGTKNSSLLIDFGKEVTFDAVTIEEEIYHGQRVEFFSVQYKTPDGAWLEYSNGTTIGNKRVILDRPVTTTQIKIEFQGLTDSEDVATPVISELGVYKATEAFEVEGAVWDGRSDTNFAVADENAEPGTATNPYIISSAAELYGMVSSGGNGKYYKVADGIDKLILNAVNGMSKSEAEEYFTRMDSATTKDLAVESPPLKWYFYSTWPDGEHDKKTAFSGHFDGNGVTIVGLYGKGDWQAHLGFIPYVENSDVTVENVKFQNAYIYSEDTRTEWGSAVVIGNYSTNSATKIKINNVSVVNSTVRDYNVAAIMGYSAVTANVAPRCEISNIVTANNTITCNADSAGRYGVVFGFYSFWNGNTVTKLSNMILADNVQFASNAEALGKTSTYTGVSFQNIYTAGAKPSESYAYTGVTFGVNADNLKGNAAKTTASALSWGEDFIAMEDGYPDLTLFHDLGEIQTLESLCDGKDDIVYKECSDCEKYVIDGVAYDELPEAPDHDYTDGVVESNCEAKEDIAYGYCDACDKYLVSDELVDELPAAPDHEYVDGICECGDREPVTDGWVDNADGTKSYYKDGALIKSNWLNLGTWYYFDANGIMCTGWKQVSGTWYYFASSGAMQTGWVSDRGTWYYCDANGAMQTGWVNDKGTWYYCDANGAMQTGWQQVGGTWYYFASGGAMQTGWQQVGGTWYYFASSGAMQTGWQQVGGTWYYFASSGAMQTGWQLIGGTWYYFASSGAMHTGWLNLGGTWYYMYSSGAMATNIYISGGYINSSGIWS